MEVELKGEMVDSFHVTFSGEGCEHLVLATVKRSLADILDSMEHKENKHHVVYCIVSELDD